MNETARRLVKLFEEKVCTIPAYMVGNEEDYFLPPIEREIFKKEIQKAYPTLRYRKIDGLESIRQFANKLEEEERVKKAFFTNALDIIRVITKHPEYTLNSVLLEEYKPAHKNGCQRLSEEAHYFLKCLKVYNALSERIYTTWVYYPPTPELEKAKNLRELIDIYYRKGRF